MSSISEFENLIAEYFNAPYAVTTDCCTHAIELCLRYTRPSSAICPRHTYLSIPMTLIKLSIPFEWYDTNWQNYYYLGKTNIIDAAVYWKQGGYKSGTFMCLSFQFRKHLNLGRGGIILTDDRDAAIKLKKMSYDGRDPNVLWKEQDIDMIGYHYYMTPEVATEGIRKFHEIKDIEPRLWSSNDYPDISKMKVFNVK